MVIGEFVRGSRAEPHLGEKGRWLKQQVRQPLYSPPKPETRNPTTRKPNFGSWGRGPGGSRCRFTEMCSGSEAGSYLRLVDFVYLSTLGLRVMKKKRRCRSEPLVPNPESRVPSPESRIPNPESRVPNPESQVPSPESRIPSPESPIPHLESRIPNPES